MYIQLLQFQSLQYLLHKYWNKVEGWMYSNPVIRVVHFAKESKQ